MSKFKKILVVLLAFVMTLSLMPAQAEAAKKVKLNKKTLSLKVGKSYTLKLKNAKSKNVKWSSSKKSVATVSQKGKVKAKKRGSCRITAKYENKKYVCKVTVKKKKTYTDDDFSDNSSNNPSNDSFSLSASETNVVIGPSGNATVNVNFSKGTRGYTYSFDISDTNVVSCKWGTWSNYSCPLYITGKKAGSTTITITNSVNNKKLVINVKYEPIKITLPTVPLTLNNYSYSNSLQQTYELTGVTYSVNGSSVSLYFSGNKLYDYRGEGQSSSLAVGWKLYKKGTSTVVKSGTCYTPGIAMGESFENKSSYVGILDNGEYELQVLNTN